MVAEAPAVEHMISDEREPVESDGLITEATIADEIRIVQSVQAQDYMPVLLFGNSYTVLAVMYLVWPAAVATGAVYAMIALLVLLLPMVLSYLKLRSRPRPESVSTRRIRSIIVYSFILGAVWATTFVLLSTQANPSDGIGLLVVAYILIYGSVAMLPSIPRASVAYMAPIVVASFIGAYRTGLLSIAWLVLLYFGFLSAVVLSMWQNWYDLKRSVRLRLENLRAQRQTEEAKEVLERVSDKLAKYISPQLYQAILRGEQDVAIASKRKKLTVFFSDVAGFTDVTDRLESEELTSLLNQYLTEMAKIAEEYGANFDKFIGDALVLYFGDPETRGVKEDATACVRMAIAMQRRMKALRREWRDAGLEKPFEIRIGINTGYCTVGNFGNEDRMDYTIIGGEVNLAARLEYEAEPGGILLANETYQLVKDSVMAEEGKIIEVKGFPRPITTYSVKGIYDELEAEGRVIHHEQAGVSLTIDRDRLGEEARARAVEALRKALEQLDPST